MEARPPDLLQVGGYPAILRRRWWLLALAAVVGLLLTVGVPGPSTKRYVSTAVVLVSPTSLDSDGVAGVRTGGGIDMESEAQLLKSVPVATRVKALLKVPDEPRELVDNVTVAAPPNTSVLKISYSAPTPEDAQLRVQAFAEAYLADRAAVAEAELKARLGTMRAQLAAARKGLREVTAKKATLAENSPERTDADFKETLLINQIRWLSAHLSPLETTVVTPGMIIASPTLPADD